jgi:hypothetical protein
MKSKASLDRRIGLLAIAGLALLASMGSIDSAGAKDRPRWKAR